MTIEENDDLYYEDEVFQIAKSECVDADTLELFYVSFDVYRNDEKQLPVGWIKHMHVIEDTLTLGAMVCKRIIQIEIYFQSAVENSEDPMVKFPCLSMGQGVAILDRYMEEMSKRCADENVLEKLDRQF